MRRLLVILLFLALPMQAFATAPVSDLNADEEVDVYDLSILLGNWSGSGAGDIDSNGTVDVFDLSLLLASMSPGSVLGDSTGPTPTPTASPISVPTTPTPTPVPTPTPAPAPVVAVYYANCTEAHAAGVTPIHEGQPGYRLALDRDHDGIACEK